MVNRSDRDPPSLNDRPSFELSGEMRRGSAKSIRARRLRPAKQAGYKPAASSVAHHTQEPLHIGRRPYNDHAQAKDPRDRRDREDRQMDPARHAGESYRPTGPELLGADDMAKAI